MDLNQVINDLREKLAKTESDRDALNHRVTDLQSANKLAREITAAHDAEVAAKAVDDSWSALSSSFDFGLYGAKLGLVDDLDVFFSQYAAKLRAKVKP